MEKFGRSWHTPSYSMRIGPYEIVSLEAGRFALDGGAMFGSVPKTIWSRTNPADGRNRIELALRVLLISTESKRILVDCGAGRVLSPKWQEIYGLDQNRHCLKQGLAKLGLRPEDVTDVVLTHLHFDHAGGMTDHTDHGLGLTFPRATHFIQQRHWQWACQPSEKDRASFLPETLGTLKSSSQVQILDGACELYPGVHLMLSDGHTPGLQMVRIEDSSNVLFYPSDLLPTASHLPLPYIMGYDLSPLTTLEEKRSALSQACEGEWVIALEHDPRYEAIRILRGEKYYEVAESLVL
ncbi:MAG TPA: MBL fold metallo-hydrolase [Terriglobia bacterium]|nr:MBL fold metallo-hydrolase [Terriglobia bacterium]